ncbi:MAG: CDP-diacylglycerol--glycerol-3-phosphate 3-phosphatidyltransferase [Deltaproteobacteria bacterium HGW-Deltaproteobacteria-10]|nr:MAG: CDP-diacylglycerol--glycerol-3-phosphate 3-phosphatidyltransferase [Deltaproteobacteria bacterium HGW-Deltaproteobacteria-10]
MNIPNFLSLLRIILVPVIVIFLIQGLYGKALFAFAVAGLTDALDGALARLLNSKTVLGSYLDPIADKLLLTASFVTLSILGIIPSWLTVIVISRDFIILLGIAILSIISVPYAINPAFVGKVTTALQISTILLALAFQSFSHDISYEWIMILCWLTGLFTIASGLTYITRGIKIINTANLKEAKK